MHGPDLDTPSCPVTPEVTTWAIGALPEHDAERIRSHVAACPPCRAEAHELQGLLAKLPGDDAPPVEPPPALREQIMAVVAAEARGPVGPGERRDLPATVSHASAPGARGTLTVERGRGVLRAAGLPAPADGAVHRIWLLARSAGGEEALVPQPGPEIHPDAQGAGWWDVGDLRDVGEVVIVTGAAGAAAGSPGRVVLRVRLP
jgi:hypothetical protein